MKVILVRDLVVQSLNNICLLVGAQCLCPGHAQRAPTGIFGDTNLPIRPLSGVQEETFLLRYCGRAMINVVPLPGSLET